MNEIISICRHVDMWKSVKSCIYAACCCYFEDDSSGTEAHTPYIVPIAENSNSTTGQNNHEPLKKQDNKLSSRKSSHIDVKEVPSVEITKQAVLDELSKQKLITVTTGISGMVTYSYVHKLSEDVHYNDISESFIERRKVGFPSFHQKVETHQGRRYDWGVINSWSRHMAETRDVKGAVPVLFRANINFNRIDIPIDAENKRLQKFKENRGKISATSNQVSAGIDTRDRLVRPKAACNQRTKHCFTNNKTEDTLRMG